MRFETKVSNDQARLRDSSPERQHLFLMLEVYWGKGDGADPPGFIKEAAALCGFPIEQREAG